MAELKPCPIPDCNGKAQIWHEQWANHWWVECSKCGTMGPIKLKQQQAIDAWNKRS